MKKPHTKSTKRECLTESTIRLILIGTLLLLFVVSITDDLKILLGCPGISIALVAVFDYYFRQRNHGSHER
jgi:hypothetical protein